MSHEGKENQTSQAKFPQKYGRVVELEYTLVLGTSGETLAGSSPVMPTKNNVGGSQVVKTQDCGSCIGGSNPLPQPNNRRLAQR